MKKFELILGGTFFLARIFALCNVPVHGFLTLVSAVLLQLTYFFLSFYLLNGKSWCDIFRKETYRNAGVYPSIMSILTGMFLSGFVSGTLYAVMGWTTTIVVFYVHVATLVFVSLALVFGLFNEKQNMFSKQNLIRIGVILFIGITSVILS